MSRYGNAKGRLHLDLMNSEARVGDDIWKELAKCLQTLSLRIGNNIRGKDSTQVLFESEGHGVFERKRYWRLAEFPSRNSSQVGVL